MSTENNHHTCPQSYLPSRLNSPSATIYHRTTKDENHKKRETDTKKHTIQFSSISTNKIPNYNKTQALQKELYPVKVNMSQGKILKQVASALPSKALGLRP